MREKSRNQLVFLNLFSIPFYSDSNHFTEHTISIIGLPLNQINNYRRQKHTKKKEKGGWMVNTPL